MAVAYDLNALSGINASANGLAVISNNLANSQSVGFKSSRAEFADMFSNSQKSPGSGVRVAAITQDFSQGTVAGTGRDLDMAIDGEGFFVLEDQTGKYDSVYTRNGSFKMDKDGYLTTQEGNRVQGYILNEELSTETKPIYDTTLNSIDLDALNKTPKATSDMTFNINLDGQEDNNVDNFQTPSAGLINNSVAGTDYDPVAGVTDPTLIPSGSTLPNIQKLTDPETEPFGGFPNFSTNKIIHDSLGGEHRMTANFYKRDVVTVANSDLTYDSATDTYTQEANPGDGDTKYTSWLVQYTIEDYDVDTDSWVTSGHREAFAAGIPAGTPPTPLKAASGDAGMIYELRFDTSGQLIDVREPNIAALAADANSTPVGQNTANTPLPDASWTVAGSAPQMQWVIDKPLTGAYDPVGTPGDPLGVGITADFSDMTQFSGSYNLRGVSQNGYQIGDLVGLSTGLDGIIEARYSNGRSIPVAQLAIATFSDKNAMEKLGGMTYAESYGSGTVNLGQPQQNGFGTIQAGSLEYSNVDVAGELVNMIQMQRMYQASAQVISTSQQLTQTILQL
ncbi:flagellar hook protein FlgE [Thiosulfativibrio zosterae]|uniref:Flagellar hook protein FlgE n=1 Tax=Thiosulfativibrio zosterae TaxID=2675053 RepID=A0A6F8PLZ6_9GAMM|nr:flagellar hook protein FlgE [Thiosulfativibrio zosterae]BBP43067.1 flagellar hook protein FlgE [Thiosulfativibrio zosterae]